MSDGEIYFYVENIYLELGNVQRIGVRRNRSFGSFLNVARIMFGHNYLHVDGRDRCGHCRDDPESILYVGGNSAGAQCVLTVTISDQSKWEELKEIARNRRHRSVDVSFVRFPCPYVVDSSEEGGWGENVCG